jgi:hypothetical protein
MPLGSTIVSDPPAETPTGAARALIAWFAGGLAFESVHAFAEGSYWATAGYGLGAAVVATADYKLKALLSGSPRLTQSLNQVASDARWWTAVAMVSLLVISLSPFVEQRRWPFSSLLQGSPTADAQQPAAAVQEVAKSDTGPKVYTTKTVDELRAICENRSEMQCEIFMSEEKGKWILIDGRAGLIQPNGFVLVHVGEHNHGVCTAARF